MTTPTTPTTSTTSQKAPPSILKSLALAVGTLTLSTWALGTLWMQAENPAAAPATPSPSLVASAANAP